MNTEKEHTRSGKSQRRQILATVSRCYSTHSFVRHSRFHASIFIGRRSGSHDRERRQGEGKHSRAPSHLKESATSDSCPSRQRQVHTVLHPSLHHREECGKKIPNCFLAVFSKAVARVGTRSHGHAGLLSILREEEEEKERGGE